MNNIASTLIVAAFLLNTLQAEARESVEQATYKAQDAQEAGGARLVAQTGYLVSINVPILNNDLAANPKKKPLIVIASCNATLDPKDLEGWVNQFSPPSAADMVASLSGPGRQTITFVVPWSWHYQVNVAIPAGGICHATAWLAN